MLTERLSSSGSALSLRLKIGIGIIVLLVTIQFGLMPLLQWQSDTQEQVISLTSAIARKKALIGNETRINTFFQESKTVLAQWRKRYPADLKENRDLQLALQKKIEALAAKHSVTIINVDWLPAVAADLLARGSIRCRMESSPDAFMHFLHALETDPHFIAVDSIRIQTQGHLKTLFMADLDISAYGILQTVTPQ